MSRSFDRSSPAGRKSWKQGTRPGRTSAAQAPGKPVGRWLLTFLLLALLAGFAYWFWPDMRGKRHLFVTALWASDQLAVPPLTFAREDVDALLKTPDVGTPIDATASSQDEANFDTLVQKVAAQAGGPKDTILFYVVAHGLTDESGAYLVCSDFSETTGEGRYPITKLLNTLSSSSAGIKFLVLDVGRIDYDPRLGIVGNEFPVEVIRAVQAVADDRLWVLLGTGTAQGVALSYESQHSVFADAVTRGLAGEATKEQDSYGDRYVDLGELYQFVTRECASWFGDELPDFQQPLLLQGGKGVVALDDIPKDDRLRLLFVTPPKPDDEQTDDSSKESDKADKAEKKKKDEGDSTSDSDTAANEAARFLFGRRSNALALLQPPATPPADPLKSKEGSETGKETGAKESQSSDKQAADKTKDGTTAKTENESPKDSDTADSTASDTKAPKADAQGKSPTMPGRSTESKAGPKKSAEGAPPTPQQQVQLELQRLWEIRDRLLSREISGLSPIDFAPHIWREAEAWILYYEQRARAGRIVGSKKAGDRDDLTELGGRLADMQQLTDELTRLTAAMSGAATTAQRDQKSVGDRLLAAWQRYERERKPADDKFEQEADETLRNARVAARQHADQIFRAVYLIRWFGIAGPTLADSSRYQNQIAAYLDELFEQSTMLRDLERTQLPASEQSRLQSFIQRQRQLSQREDELNSELLAIENSVLANPRSRVSRLRAQQLLATPLLPASRRAELSVRLLSSSSSSAPVEPSRSALTVGGQGRLNAHRRSCLVLESKLIRLFDDESARRISGMAADAGIGESQEVESARLRKGVRELAIFYAALPRSLPNDVSLMAVDPRDASDVRANEFPMPEFKIELERAPELRLAPLADEIQLLEGTPTKLVVTLRATKRNLLDARIVAENSESLLTIDSKTETDLPPERGWFGKRIEWQVTAKPAAVSERKARTAISVTAAADSGLKQTALIDVDLPQPNRIDVQFARVGSFSAPLLTQGDLQLGLFSNRRTKFQLALVNQHDQKKTVNVALYAVGVRPNSASPIGRFDNAFRQTVYDANSRTFVNARLIAKSEKPVELPAADPRNPRKEPIFFTWVDPNAAPTAAPAAGAAPPAANAAIPAPPPLPIHGLVLEITDAQNTAQVYPVKWIELEPLLPRDFLNVDVGYDQRRQQILARIVPKNVNADGAAELPAGNPVQINWDASGAGLPPEGIKNLQGEIDGASPEPEAVLTAEAPADGQNRIVKIGVDGYPRAFLYRVPCRKDVTKGDYIRSFEDLERETTSVRIESVAVPSQNRAYHYIPDIQIAPPTDEKAPKIEHLFLQPRQPALFRAPAETIVVNLQADAPIDAFRSETDRVQVILRDRNLGPTISRTIRADRDFKAFYVGATARGVIELECSVGDLSIELPARRLANAQPVVEATIRFGTTDHDSSVQLQLDGDRPRIESLQVRPPYVKDGKVVGSLRVADYQGVGRVLYGFSKDGSKQLADADAKSIAVTPRLDEDRRHAVDFFVDLKDRPTGRNLLLVKVLDNVGHESEIFSRDIVITDPMAMPQTGEIRGVIRYGRAQINGTRFKMTIEGGDLGPTPVPIQPDGSFLVTDLPITEYTLKVSEGQFNNKIVPPKEQKGVKPADPKKSQPIVIDLSG